MRDPSKLTAANKIKEDDAESVDSQDTVKVQRKQKL